MSVRIGLIGHGAIGEPVARAIASGAAGDARLGAVLCRVPSRRLSLNAEGVVVTADPVEFHATALDLVVEVAGQDALRACAVAALAGGADLLATSIGAFTDDEFLRRVVAQAEASGRRLLLAAGALPAVQWMHAAAAVGACKVRITQEKPAYAWRQTPAALELDLESLRAPTCFFEGTARMAASRYPRSSNITAMLALATAGLDSTEVRLIADPTATRMRTYIEFESAAGRLNLDWRGVPSELNPSTSADVAHAVIRAIRNRTATVEFGA